MLPFLPGVELNRLFFTEVVQPLLAEHFPSLRYSAALIGYGSDVLGYDTPRSTDHEWGPRLLLFLPDDARYAADAAGVADLLRRELPTSFRGYSTSFGPGAGDGVRVLAEARAGEIHHHVDVWTVSAFLRWELGVESVHALSVADWLTFPQQKLLEVTAGAVYLDGLEALISLRRALAFYPHDMWLYLLSVQWMRLSQEEAFVGRCVEAGDEIGAQIIAARLARDVMRLCLLLERRYAPYSKWLGAAFASLACASRVQPLLAAALNASDGEERQARLAAAFEAVAELHNALGVTKPVDPHARAYHGRPYRVLHAERFAEATRAAVTDARVAAVYEAVGYLGAIDQFADSTDLLTHATLCARLRALFSA